MEAWQCPWLKDRSALRPGMVSCLLGHLFGSQDHLNVLWAWQVDWVPSVVTMVESGHNHRPGTLPWIQVGHRTGLLALLSSACRAGGSPGPLQSHLTEGAFYFKYADPDAAPWTGGKAGTR